MKFLEHFKRSIVKTITYRLLIIVSTFMISWILTGETTLAAGITTTATVVNTVIYYTHERIWNRIHWGKQKK